VGSLLIRQWLAGCDVLATRDDASISQARQLTRDRGAAVGLDAIKREELAAAVSELARNQLRHAIGGELGFRAVARDGVAGLEVVAADRGGGIADPTAAFSGATRIAGSLGVGLAAAYRQSHEMDLDIRWGEGTAVTIRSFATPPAVRSELAVLSRPCPGEAISGDHAFVRRRGDDVTIAVVDGLGHGVLAREPADAAIAEVARDPERALDELALATDTALAGSRGVVMAAARFSISSARLQLAGVGNVSTRIVRPDGTTRILPSLPGVLGGSTRPRRPRVEQEPVGRAALVVMATDGLVTHIDFEKEIALLRRPPPLIAHHLVTTYARPDDDILVVVAR
jgi:anti-sigma regulatory factor (Ser/Thr protein kinase)